MSEKKLPTLPTPQWVDIDRAEWVKIMRLLAQYGGDTSADEMSDAEMLESYDPYSMVGQLAHDRDRYLKMARHYHKAKWTWTGSGGHRVLTDECDRCGLDIRDEVHIRSEKQ